MKKIKNITLLLCIPLLFGCTSPKGESKEQTKEITINPCKEVEIDEMDPYRPLHHFTVKNGWINDPNGMIYDASTKTYHMYYQYSTVVTEASKYWGHATSPDLLNWTDHGIVISPDEDGDIWSGCCVNDINNDTGLFNDSIAPESRIVSIFTYHTYSGSIGDSVKLYYSLDKGYTFQEHGIVIDNADNKYGDNMRDPKVRYLEEYNIWLMAIGGYNGTIRLFTSNNLLKWTLNSEIHNHELNDGDKNCECVDLFPIKVEGTNETKWVLALSMSVYWVGDLKRGSNGMFTYESITGRLFTRDHIYKDNGAGRAYGGSTFYGIDNRVVSVSWLVDRTAHAVTNKSWNGYQSLMIEHHLYKENNAYFLKSLPVSECNEARKHLILTGENVTLNKSQDIFSSIESAFFDLEMEVETAELSDLRIEARKKNKNHTAFIYSKTDQTFVLSAARTGNIYNYKVTSKVDKGDTIKIRIIFDNSIIETFINDGKNWQSGQVLPEYDARKLSLSFNGTLKIKSINLYEIGNIER